nr:roadblock/LC7 domain-containing protein [Planosporangium flavigriseum]
MADLRRRLPELAGTVLATTDGLLLAHDAHDLEPDSVAALAAAHLALAQRFADAVGHGELRETVIECGNGYLTTYAAGPNAVLALVTRKDANLARAHLEARRTTAKVGALIAANPPDSPPPPVAPAVPAVPIIPAQVPPLTRRTPMAALADLVPTEPGFWLNPPQR